MVGEHFERSGETPLGNLIALASPLTNKLFLIIGDYPNSIPGVKIIKIKTTRRRLVVARVFQQVLTHLRVLLIMAKLRKEIDILIYIFGTPFPIPLVFAQALNTRCFIILARQGYGTDAEALKESGAPRQFGELTRLRVQAALERISYSFADKLVVYSPSMIDRMNLQKYSKKIVVAHRHFVNFDECKFKDNIEQRDNIIGYVGRITADKGIWNFVGAIPKILSVHDDVTFLIAGEGLLEDEIRVYLEKHGLRNKVKLAGWIPHQKLPDYLTSLKLLVLPSYNEGLPNVMLEAMACGTPVLAVRVASIPDVIKDKETGFLIQDNSPAHLANAIVETLTNPELKRIAANAHTLAESEFRYENLTQTWKDIICSAKKGTSD
jgi:glycosyltransferase involved in cell wall biosynthesis